MREDIHAGLVSVRIAYFYWDWSVKVNVVLIRKQPM